MGTPRPHHAGVSKRLASAFSASCGALALGLTVAACYGLAHAAQTLLGLAVPGLLVRLAACLLGVPAAFVAEAVAFRLIAGRRRPPTPEPPALPAGKLPADEFLTRLPRLKPIPPNHFTHQ
jgi:hypothetical protein